MALKHYTTLLAKMANAAEGDGTHEAISRPDNVESTTTDHNRIMDDSRSYLHSIFSQASEVQSNQSAELKKMFSMPHNTVTSNPLIKVAFREVFFQAMDDANLLKIASSIHQEVAFNAFFDELEKIAMAMPPPMPSSSPMMGMGKSMAGGRSAMPAAGNAGMSAGAAPRQF
jgi:hypothetical protein